jgi:dTDP-4-amino-4,6-dideoxygalactose transaminase
MHKEHTEVGFDYRSNNQFAKVAYSRPERLPATTPRPVVIDQRQRRASADTAGVLFMPMADSGWNGWLTCLVFDNPQERDTVQQMLAEHDIESRPLCKPMHQQPASDDAAARVDGTSQRHFEQGLCLPNGSVLTDKQIDRVIELTSKRARPTVR